MSEIRLTYIPLEIADHFDDFIITKNERILDAIKARARDFSTLSLVKLLYQLSSGPMNFSDLYARSKIRMKKSFLSYLRFCVDYNFVTKQSEGQNMIYSITDKGRVMLGLFMQKGSQIYS